MSSDWFHYTPETEGWGCMWHSVQNAILHVVCEGTHAERVPSVDELMDTLRGRCQDDKDLVMRVFDEEPRRWIEPAIAKRLGPCWDNGSIRLETMRVGANRYLFQKTRREDYDVEIEFDGSDFSAIDALYDRLIDPRSPRLAVLLDDGYSGYCAVPAASDDSAGGRALRLIDPHTLDPITDVTLWDRQKFREFCQGGAMMCAISAS